MDISKINPKKLKRMRKYIKRHVANLGPNRMQLHLMANLVRHRWFRKHEFEVSWPWAKEIVDQLVDQSFFMKLYTRQHGRLERIYIKEINRKL